MIFTNDDLKRLTEFVNQHALSPETVNTDKLKIPRNLMAALLARLEAAENIIAQENSRCSSCDDILTSTDTYNETYKAWRKACGEAGE